MALNFHNKKHNDSESFWTSYSDLFLGLSSIFLLLYVVASLRSGTDGIKNAVENQKLKVEVMDLKNQLKTYEAMKEQYIQNQASKGEVSEYNELMDKLALLQDEAKTEKNKLRKAAHDNDQKEKALNKYQQMIRNVINSSAIAKVKINNRNEVINEREETIGDQQQEISQKNTQITGLNQNISMMENVIQTKENQISQAKSELNQKMAQLKQAFQHQKLSQKAYQASLKKLQDSAHQQMQSLAQQKAQAEQNLGQTQRQLASVKDSLAQSEGALAKSQDDLKLKGDQISQLNQQIGQLNAEGQAKVAALKGKYDAERAADKAAFDRAMQNQKNLGAAEIARREGEFKAAAAAKERKLAGEMAGLMGQLKDTEGKLAQANAELAARKQIAQEIREGFKRAGVKADIDMGTGDVVLDFGATVFDSDSANLKEEMKNVLQKAMPSYAKSLFGNPKVANQISSVEIVGFASPTYRGKIVDPNSTAPQDREALKYNMDLSYKRAKSIFNYILDENQMNFTHRDTMVPALKVSGRSFLDLMKMDRSVASVQDYCVKYDCKKSQKVVIKFNMSKK